MTNEKYINAAHRLILSYLNSASLMCSTLRDAFNVNADLLTARRQNQIPKEGHVGDIYFCFHGVGCYFEYKNGHIDIDFASNGDCNGFDPFRLHDFVTNIKANDKDVYAEVVDEQKLIEQFDQLKSLGVIYSPQSAPSPHLYFLSNSI